MHENRRQNEKILFHRPLVDVLRVFTPPDIGIRGNHHVSRITDLSGYCLGW